MAVGGLGIAHRADDSVGNIWDKEQRARGTQKSVPDRPGDVDNIQDAVREIEPRIMHGTKSSSTDPAPS